MSQLLKADFYRLFRSISFYICAVISIFLFLLNYLSAYLGSKAGPEFEYLKEFLPKNGLDYGLGAFSNGNVQMILGIITAIFITAEFSKGTMKNAVSKGFSRVKIYFAKLITITVAVYLIILSTLLAGMLVVSITSGDVGDFSSKGIQELLKVTGMMLLLNAALSSVLAFTAILVRNLGGTIAVNILGVFSFFPLIFYLLELLFKHKIKFASVELLNNMGSFLTQTDTSPNYLRAVLVALVYFGVTTTLGILAFTKSDIK